MLFGRKFRKTLSRALKGKLAIPVAVSRLADLEVESVAEAEVVVQLLGRFPLPEDGGGKRSITSPLHTVVGWMQSVEHADARAHFAEAGAPELLRIFDEAFAGLVAARAAGEAEDPFGVQNDLDFLLKVAGIYAPPGGAERVRVAARSPFLRDGWLWSVIFQPFRVAEHPWRAELMESLADPVPEGQAGIAYLDLMNEAGREGSLEHHPYDTPQGAERLRVLLTDPDEDNFACAISAAAAIPFLSKDRRVEMLDLADRHPDRAIRLEAAWAAAHVGDDRGLDTLLEASMDPTFSGAARQYLAELGAEDCIPAQALTPDFQALSDMSDWLAHWMEYGRRPQRVELMDTRELWWPPTGDRRRLWIVRYEYPPGEGKTEPDVGVGLVGSVTFALFSKTTADQTPEEIYARHCIWELDMDEDHPASDRRTVEAGLKLLAAHNPDLYAT